METITWHPPASLDTVKGWFYPKDQALMTWLLDRQDRLEPPGDLLELGSYLGKSAILLGSHRRPGETFTVCDLFDSTPSDERNKTENAWSYSALTRQAFEGNYLTFHEELPTIVQSATDEITRHVAAGSCRFVHIDASHLWQHVQGDIGAARLLLRPGGLVVCDDYRSEHTPGVAAAVWTAVADKGLRPICLSGNKFYGTWGDPEPVQAELVAWLNSFHRHLPEYQDILGHRIVRVCRWDDPPTPALKPLRAAPEADAARSAPTLPRPQPDAADSAPTRAHERPSRWSSPRSIAEQLLPPVVTRAVRRARAR
jgi:predicted O-methyltransferase YrrM